MKEFDNMYGEFVNYLKTVAAKSNEKQKGGNDSKFNEMISERLLGYIQTMYKYVRANLV